MSALPDLTTLRFVTRADVHKAGVLAGFLERAPSGEVTFRYREGYTGEPVATTLPITDRPVIRPGGGLPPYFAGLLPEGHRLTVLQRETKTSADDELTVLLAVGADAPGDVQVVPADQPAVEPVPLADDDPARLDFRQLTDMPDRHALPGVQAKASATMLTAPLATTRERALLKIDPPQYPHLVANETLHLGAARGLKIAVAQHRLVRDVNDVPGLLVTRFDRVHTEDGGVERLAMEDASQVLDMLPAAKYTVTSEQVVQALARRAAAPMIAARNLYLQFLFAWLTGNGDLHAKNVSILRDRGGRWQVAPIYDVPCTAVYRDFTMALPVDGRTSTIRRRHWSAFADAIGLPPAAARSAMTLALRAARGVDLGTLPFEGSSLNGALRELGRRRSELEP
ncbi:type II toxin-antitoxin system HipA family toxin [Brachybacterium paraconglomeratum]|uniref:type II toxin-antitoxin system HipA family toxin n=1 Tax=Brachybacterium paraconglomeratum TaxID=173362 RepID=UPI0031EDCFC4